MTPTETEELKKFLVLAAANGYAGDAKKTKEADGSDTIEFADGIWRFHDNYFTNPADTNFYGREVVFKNGKPYWFMGYAGFVDPAADVEEVYTFLKTAMLKPDEDMPIRGPIDFELEDWRYALHADTDLAQFYAAEWIKHDGTDVYLAHLHGGVIK